MPRKPWEFKTIRWESGEVNMAMVNARVYETEDEARKVADEELQKIPGPEGLTYKTDPEDPGRIEYYRMVLSHWADWKFQIEDAKPGTRGAMKCWTFEVVEFYKEDDTNA